MNATGPTATGGASGTMGPDASASLDGGRGGQGGENGEASGGTASGGTPSGGMPSGGTASGGAGSEGGADAGAGARGADAGGPDGGGGTAGARSDGSPLDSSALSDADCPARDCCPGDPDKDAPGQCGCGVPDTDRDDDAVADCIDGCPDDPNKTEPRVCGCGVIDNALGCPQFSLIHRYRFDGTGTIAEDSQGNADGTIVNTSLTGSGSLLLVGGTTDQYVRLPAGVVSALTNATFELWLTWNGGNAWQRIFDFGDNDGSTEGGQGNNGLSYLMLTPLPSNGSNMRVAFTVSGGSAETLVNANSAFPTSTQTHVAVVVDETNGTLDLYIDGTRRGSTAFSGSLQGVNDVNNWLGRSQFAQDPELSAVLHDFRIYNSALDAELVQMSYAAGPDAP